MSTTRVNNKRRNFFVQSLAILAGVISFKKINFNNENKKWFEAHQPADHELAHDYVKKLNLVSVMTLGAINYVEKHHELHSLNKNGDFEHYLKANTSHLENACRAEVANFFTNEELIEISKMNSELHQKMLLAPLYFMRNESQIITANKVLLETYQKNNSKLS